MIAQFIMGLPMAFIPIGNAETLPKTIVIDDL